MQRATATPALTPEEEAAARKCLVERVPDFLWSSYPFDVPPGRMAGVRYILTLFQAHRHCPRGSCRRARRCLGGDGPPCFRADRKELRKILLLSWSNLFLGLPEEAFAAGLDKLGDRYEMLCRCRNRKTSRAIARRGHEGRHGRRRGASSPDRGLRVNAFGSTIAPGPQEALEGSGE